MKTFKELQEGDKLFIYADKPFRDRDHSNDYWTSEPFISGIYEIEKATKMGVYMRFSLRDIIGSKIHTYVNTNDLILSARKSTSVERTLCFGSMDSDYNYYHYRQNIIITTSEEEWLEKINENV